MSTQVAADIDGPDLEEECEELLAAWSLRALAVVLLVAGSLGASSSNAADAAICPHAASIGGFWEIVRQVSGVWLCLDVFACAFLLRWTWPQPSLGYVARLVALAGWCLSLYGLSQYALQAGQSRCWSAPSVLAAVLMLGYAAGFALCVSLDAGCRAHLVETFGLFGEPQEWPICRDADSDEERGRGGRASRGASPVIREIAPGGEKTVSASPGLRSALPGRRNSAGRRSSATPIRVLRGGTVLYAGRTRAAVVRWARRNLPNAADRQGVTVEDAGAACLEPTSSQPSVVSSPRSAQEEEFPALREPPSPPSQSPPAAAATAAADLLGGDLEQAPRAAAPPLDLLGGDTDAQRSGEALGPTSPPHNSPAAQPLELGVSSLIQS